MERFMSSIRRAAKAAPAVASILFFSAAACSHEHWFDPSDFYPAAGTEVGFGVCSGHHYPESGFAVKDEVLCGVMLALPGGEAVKTAIARGERMHTGSFTPVSDGVHLLTLALKRPGAKDPVFELKAIIVSGGKDDPSVYSTGKGMEIVPGIALSATVAPCEIPFYILLDGQRTEGTLTLFDDKGESAGFKAEKEKPAPVGVTGAGRYLLVAGSGGRECSLVFEIRGSEKK